MELEGLLGVNYFPRKEGRKEFMFFPFLYFLEKFGKGKGIGFYMGGWEGGIFPGKNLFGDLAEISLKFSGPLKRGLFPWVVN